MMNELQSALIKLGLLEVCVTKVYISPDWKYSNVYFIKTNDQYSVQSTLNLIKSMTHQIAALVKKRCSGHFFPKFRFIFDEHALQSLHVDEILRNLDEIA